jgi:hypothetical protein
MAERFTLAQASGRPGQQQGGVAVVEDLQQFLRRASQIATTAGGPPASPALQGRQPWLGQGA